MRTLTRSLITVGTAVAVFAGSFAIATAVSGERDFPEVDAPLAVPPSTVVEVPVLAPVAFGEAEDAADASTYGLSEEIGTAQVVVPEEELDGAIAPELIAAAAALDSVAGDASAALPTTPEGDEPAPSPASDLSPASDPCAPADGPPDAEACPAGVTATLFGLPGDETLQVWATADPVTGPGMGSSIVCAATDTPAGVLRLGALTTAVATVAITYWPQDNPSATQTVDLTQTAVFLEGSAQHCGQTLVLEEGEYDAMAIAQGADGAFGPVWEFSFDSRGRPTTPSMRVIPLGTNWVWVGVYHTAGAQAEITGFPLNAGGPTTCADAREADLLELREDVGVHTTVIPPAWLDARNIDSAYSRVTSALLYVPEGTSAGLCGLTFNDGEPSWDMYEPDRIEFVTIAAPDRWEAVVTLRSMTAYRPGQVVFAAIGHTGGGCGYSTTVTHDGPVSDRPTTVESGWELCRIAGQNIQLSVFSFYHLDSGASAAAESRSRFLLMNEHCTGVCPEPAPRTYTVFVPGLGQDMCPDSVEDDCALRRRTAGAFATIDVTWEQGGSGTRAEWGVSSVGEEAAPSAGASDVARFDVLSYLDMELSRDGFSVNGSTTLTWDRPVTYSAQIVGMCFNGDPTATPPGPHTGTATPAGTGIYSARVDLRNLCPGRLYGLVVTYTDASGVTQVAAPDAIEGVTPDVLWLQGVTMTPHRRLEVTATLELFKHDRVDVSYLVRDSFVEIGYARVNPSFGRFLGARCFSGPSAMSEPSSDSVQLERTYNIEPAINLLSDWHYYPNSSDCSWRRDTWWVPEGNHTATYTQLLDGVVFTGDMVTRDIPGAEDPVPWTYRLTLTAEWVPEDD